MVLGPSGRCARDEARLGSCVVTPRPRSVTIGYYFGIVLLVGVLAIAAVLLVQVVRPASGPRIDVSPAMATPCDPGDGAPGCYTFTVTNAGSDLAAVECLVIPAEGTTARFATEQSTTVLTLQSHEERMLRTTVDPFVGDAVAAPSLNCTTL